MTALNWNSQNLTHGWQRGLTAFYYGLGWSEADLNRPQIGIGVPLLDGNLCNVHAYTLAKTIAESCQQAGAIGLPFGVPAVSDNITQGHAGGNASLPSRNMIANGAEAVVSAHGYDCLIGLHNCDKNGPGFAMALARLNYPGLIVSGGTIHPGCHNGKDISILDVYDSQAAAQVGEIPESEAEAILKSACPGPGGCGIAASFNTWGIALEAMGLMLPGSSTNPAISDEKQQECQQLGSAITHLLETGIRPRDILTRTALTNAAVAVAAAGGSTNAVLHLLAVAREAGVDFGLMDLQNIFRNTPVLCQLAPRGRYTMVDLFKLGGTPLYLKHLLDGDLLYGSAITVTGKTIAENLQDVPAVPENQDLIAPLEKPFKAYADMQICFGNLAPDGMVFKVSSMQQPSFRGTALCFDRAEDVVEAGRQKQIKPGHIIVLRNLGPVASGMPEVLVASAALAVEELDGKVAMISDTRVSGVSHGAIGVHCAPEAIVGGPIGLVQDGDQITFDLQQGTVEWHVDEAEITRRKSNQHHSMIQHDRVYLADYSATVTQANHGCVSRCVIGEEYGP